MNLTSSKNWKTVDLGELAIFSNGRTSPDRLDYGEYPIFGANGIIGFSDQKNKKENSIIIGRVGSYCGSLYFSDKESWVTDNAIACNARENSDAKFIFYLLGTLKLNSRATGSGQPLINQATLNSIEVFVPKSNEEQKEIAEMFGSLDDKIELLRKENKTLENIAQTLFKEWFVDFNFPGSVGKMIDSELGEIPEGWRIGKLIDLNAEITDYVANGSFASLKENVTLYDTKNYALFIRNTDLKSSFQQKVYVDERSYKFLKKTQLFGGEIIISNVGDVGSVFFCPFFDFPMVLGNNTISLKSKNQGFFYTLFTNRIGQFLINSITGGSAQPKFNKTDFRNLRMIIPSNFVLGLFEDVVWPVYKKILKNDTEIQTLSKLRDELLNNIFSV